MSQIKDSLTPEQKKEMTKIKGYRAGERPEVSAEAYENRLDAIVKWCEKPRVGSEVAQEFGYAPASIYVVLTKLVKQKRLTKVGRRYQSITTTRVYPPNLPPWPDYVEQLGREFAYDHPHGTIKEFVEYCRAGAAKHGWATGKDDNLEGTYEANQQKTT